MHPRSGEDSVVQLLSSLCGTSKQYNTSKKNGTYPDSANPWVLPINSAIFTVTMGDFMLVVAEKHLNITYISAVVLLVRTFLRLSLPGGCCTQKVLNDPQQSALHVHVTGGKDAVHQT